MLKNTKTLFLQAALFLTLTPLASNADQIVGQIVDVHDGDTLTMYVPSEAKKYKIRMLGVDTPEVDFNQKSQGDAAFEARDFLRSLAPNGSTATVYFEAGGMDKHNRVLGEIVVDSININEEMLRQGWGYLYFIYPFNKKQVLKYSALAQEAVEQERGLFSPRFASTQAPYDFRLAVRNHVGRNLVGDLRTKTLYSPDQSALIPVWARVFFPDQDLARSNGYQYSH